MCEAVEGLAEGLIGNLEVVVRVREGGECVVVASIVCDELSVLVLRRVLLGAHKEHVLQEVSHAVKRFGVQGGANVDVERCATFVGLVVLDEQAAQLIAQLDALVLALVTLRLGDFGVTLHSE